VTTPGVGCDPADVAEGLPVPSRFQGPDDPVMRVVRVLLVVLWPVVALQVVPGQSRPGTGIVLAWCLLVLYTAGTVVFLAAGRNPQRVLPVVLALLTASGVVGAPTGTTPESALLVPLFLGALTVLAALRLTPRAVHLQIVVASLGSVFCIAYVADSPLQAAGASLAVAGAIAAPALAVVSLRRQLDEAHRREHRLARTDPLTGTLNRRGLFEAAADLMTEGVAVDVITLDLDDFKQLNDSHGHAVGDEALKAVSTGLSALETDGVCPAPVLVARLGGEEFLVLATAGATELPAVAEAVRAAAAVRVGAGPRTSASVGAVRRVPPAEPEERIGWLMRQIDVADTLMYRAKRSGGDRVLAERV
jgi:diguanylate cyclase (GGDEF)-like protein